MGKKLQISSLFTYRAEIRKKNETHFNMRLVLESMKGKSGFNS